VGASYEGFRFRASSLEERAVKVNVPVVLGAALLLTVGSATALRGQTPTAFIVESPTMTTGRFMPRDYSPDGRNVSPPLRSKSRAYPEGLSNNHGQVGRHYFSHHQGAGVGALFSYDLKAWYGLPAQGVAVDDWADDNFDHSDLDFVGGGNLWVMSDRQPISAASMSTYGQSRNWGIAWKRFIHEHSDRSHGSYIQKTTLPYEDNYLDLDPQVTDPLRLPVIRITGQFKDNELAIAAFMQDRMEEWYREAGAVEVNRGGLGNTMGASTHAYGGTRMGDDAETNVVDRWGFSHEAPNLGVLGASVMGTSGARNPTLTSQALAWRTAAHLVDSWRDIAK
jgi:gluconate 2-dehydrogenase alpha chain